jgi:general L-amino acid transport system substrate-binding protein
MNRVNGGDTGLLYSFPFGKLDVLGADIEQSSPTIRAIRDRGFLKCGINKRKGFATFDPVTRSWSGFDVELCRAIAAAVFEQGTQDDHVIYSDLPTSQRFQVLADGRVDVLARLTTWTMQRDVQENATSRAFSFATPYFHDGVQFGGLPPFSTCAENLDVFSPECQPLKICVLDGSTSHDKLQQLFHARYYTTKLIFDEIIQALNAGTCNALAGGFHDVAAATIREKGYNGTYEVAPTRFSKDPLGIVTRQDGGDVVWSDFVRWIFFSLVYAEEHNITQATAVDMPRSTLFGPLRSETFFHVINTVGNYGEMYERNFAELANRGGLNALNDNGGPQMYALAGI